jgi:hypothetical protein
MEITLQERSNLIDYCGSWLTSFLNSKKVPLSPEKDTVTFPVMVTVYNIFLVFNAILSK